MIIYYCELRNKVSRGIDVCQVTVIENLLYDGTIDYVAAK